MSLLKDASFTTTILLPAGIVMLIFMASGMLPVTVLVWITRENIVRAFTPEFIQLLVLFGFALAGCAIVLLCSTAYMIARLPKETTPGTKEVVAGDVRYIAADATTVRKNVEEYLG